MEKGGDREQASRRERPRLPGGPKHTVEAMRELLPAHPPRNDMTPWWKVMTLSAKLRQRSR